MNWPTLNVENIFKLSRRLPYDLNPDDKSPDKEKPYVIHSDQWNFKAARAFIFELMQSPVIADAFDEIDHETRIDIILSLAETIQSVYEMNESRQVMIDRLSLSVYIDSVRQFPFDMAVPGDGEDIPYIADVKNADSPDYIAARAVMANLMDKRGIKWALEDIPREERLSLIERLAVIINASCTPE